MTVTACYQNILCITDTSELAPYSYPSLSVAPLPFTYFVLFLGLDERQDGALLRHSKILTISPFLTFSLPTSFNCPVLVLFHLLLHNNSSRPSSGSVAKLSCAAPPSDLTSFSLPLPVRLASVRPLQRDLPQSILVWPLETGACTLLNPLFEINSPLYRDYRIESLGCRNLSSLGDPRPWRLVTLTPWNPWPLAPHRSSHFILPPL
jgi:hypothetical protein